MLKGKKVSMIATHVLFFFSRCQHNQDLRKVGTVDPKHGPGLQAIESARLEQGVETDSAHVGGLLVGNEDLK